MHIYIGIIKYSITHNHIRSKVIGNFNLDLIGAAEVGEYNALVINQQLHI